MPQWLASLTIKGVVTFAVVGAILTAFVIVFWRSVIPALPAEVYVMVVGGVMTMGSTIVGVWFGQQSSRNREEEGRWTSMSARQWA